MEKFQVQFQDTPFLETSQVFADSERLNWRSDVLLTRNKNIIQNQRILDLASHDGRFSYACLKLGAKHVTGVEGRSHLVESAGENLKKMGFDSSRFEFICDDLFNYLPKIDPQQFDTILCFGFFYHTIRQAELISHIKRLSPQYFMLDTTTKRIPKIIRTIQKLNRVGLFKPQQKSSMNESPIAELLNEQYGVYRLEDPQQDANTVDAMNLVFIPTDKLIKMLLKAYGFECQTIEWPIHEIKNFNSLLDYRVGQRMSYLAQLM